MKVLVACEFSGIVREAFIARGHDAWSCDLLDTDIPGNHIKNDVLLHLHEGWDLMIAHPPCTFLCNSGVSWLSRDHSRKKKMEEAAQFFLTLLHATIPRKCIENPIMHKYAKEIIGYQQSQVIQPWMFGHGETKATCLWLFGLPLLCPTHRKDDLFCEPEPEAREQRLHKLPPSPGRWKERSRTFTGIAKAMAEQWG